MCEVFPFRASFGGQSQGFMQATQEEQPLDIEEQTQVELTESLPVEASKEQQAAPQPWGRLIWMSGGAKPIDLESREEVPGRALNQVTLGRNKACDVVINEPRVSSTHCRIFCTRSSSSFGSTAMEVYIEDLSSNGTYVNGDCRLRNREKRRLNAGDEISLCRPNAAGQAPSAVSFTFVLLHRRGATPRGQTIAVANGVAVVNGFGPGLAGASSENARSDAPAVASAAAPPSNDGSATASQLTLSSTTVTAGNISDEYDIRHVIGHGQCGEVRMAIQRRTGKPVAVKEIKTKRFRMTPGLSATDLVQEAEMLRAVTHPYIVQLVDIFMTDSVLFFVMELVEGGDLFDRIVDKGSYSEPLARELMKRVLEAVLYLHSKDIVHRDLKPENILLARRDDDVDVKITDFGLAKRANKDGLKTFCGTPQYFAPEVLKRRNTLQGAGRYGKEADMWSLGVILYILLSGTHPFHDDTLFEQIQGACYSLDGPDWDEISAEAKDLISRLLVTEPEERLSAESALQHPFITQKPLFEYASRLAAASAAEIGGSSGGSGKVSRNGSTTTVRSSSSSGDEAAAAQGAANGAGLANGHGVGNPAGGGSGGSAQDLLANGVMAAAVRGGAPAGLTNGDVAAAAANGGGHSVAGQRSDKAANRPRGSNKRAGKGAAVAAGAAYSQLTLVKAESASPEQGESANEQPAQAAWKPPSFPASLGVAAGSHPAKMNLAQTPNTATARLARMGSRAGNGARSVAAGSFFPVMSFAGVGGGAAAAAGGPIGAQQTALAAPAAAVAPLPTGMDVSPLPNSKREGSRDEVDEIDESSDGTPGKPRRKVAAAAAAAVSVATANGGGARGKKRNGKAKSAAGDTDWAVPTPGRAGAKRRRVKDAANGGTITGMLDSIAQLAIGSPGNGKEEGMGVGYAPFCDIGASPPAAATGAAAAANGTSSPAAGQAPSPVPFKLANGAAGAAAGAGAASKRRQPAAAGAAAAAAAPSSSGSQAPAAEVRATKKAKAAGAGSAPQRTLTSFFKEHGSK